MLVLSHIVANVYEICLSGHNATYDFELFAELHVRHVWFYA